MYKKFEFLKKKDCAGIIVPSSPVKEPYISGGLKELESAGFSYKLCDDLQSNNGVVAKSPEESTRDLVNFFDDPSVKYIICGRGGYGSNRVLRTLDTVEFKAEKAVIGSSDASYLLWYLMDRFRIVVFYGPMVFSSMAEFKYNRDDFIQSLRGERESCEISGNNLIKGYAQGLTSGGCLTCLASLCGTDYMPDLREKIVLLEDVAERPYKLERMIWQLKESGALDNAAGIITGEFPGCFLYDNERELFYSRVREILYDLKIPVSCDYPFGHSSDIRIFPLGVNCTLECSDQKSQLRYESGFYREEK